MLPIVYGKWWNITRFILNFQKTYEYLTKGLKLPNYVETGGGGMLRFHYKLVDFVDERFKKGVY